MGVAGRLSLALIASLTAALLGLGGSLLLNLSHHMVAQATIQAQDVATETARLASSPGVNGQQLSLNDPGMLGAAMGRSHLYLQISQGQQIVQRSKSLGTAALPMAIPPQHNWSWEPLPLWGTRSHLVHIHGIPAVYGRSAVRQHGHVIGYVESAVSLQATLRTVQTVENGLIRVGLVIMAIASSLSAWFVYRAFHRVRRLSRAARQVESAKDLGRRISASAPRDEVWELAQSFNHMMNQLDQSFQGQQLMTAHASHQLRTPLATAIGYASMLQKWGKTDPELVSESLNAIHEQLLRLQQIIDVILRLAELEAPDHRMPAYRSISAFIGDWQLDVSLPVRILGGPAVDARFDPEMLAEVLSIMIDNTGRHAGPHPHMTVAWRVTSHGLELRIEDDGPGFPPDLLPHLFQPFAKADWSSGMGLGMALARALVEHQGGQIAAENAAPNGARLLITLPIVNRP